MVKIYTKTGDDGTTGLVGGSRVKKFDARLEAYGTIDELNAAIGLLRSYPLSAEITELFIQIQNKLFNIGSRLASDEKGAAYTASLVITKENIKILEDAIDKFEENLPALSYFILPGGDLQSAQCHVVRTICRRAERRILEFAETNEVEPEIIQFVNRLSDFMFVLARKLAVENKNKEVAWTK